MPNRNNSNNNHGLGGMRGRTSSDSLSTADTTTTRSSFSSATSSSVMAISPTPTDASLDEAKVADFFNNLELEEDAKADLALLVEAEDRGLLDGVTSKLLSEARKRGWLPEKEIEDDAVYTYDGRYFGSDNIFVDVGHFPRAREVGACLSELHKRHDKHVSSIFELTAGTVTITSNPKATLTLRRIRRPSSEQATVQTQFKTKAVKSCLTFDKTVGFVLATDSKTHFKCIGFKCKTAKKANELAKTLNRACSKARKQARSKVYPLRRVNLRGSKKGFGFKFTGPAAGDNVFKGIFITEIQPGTPAASNPEMQRGLQIMSINGISTVDSTIAECTSLLRASGSNVVLELQENPTQFAAHDPLRPVVHFTEKVKTTHDLESDLDDVMSDLLNFSVDMSFSQPMRMVAGKAVFD
eukprot:m.105879 g.105879  ORF g.105879 m.105879 type:complete len:411 (+) comp22513_c0_seq1:46-1278(+)